MKITTERNLQVEKAIICRQTLTEENPILVSRKTIAAISQERFNLHDYWEMGVVLSGSYLSIVGINTFTLYPGGIWWHGPWELHGYATLAPQTTIVVAEFIPSLLFTIPSVENFSYYAYLPFFQPAIRTKLQPATGPEKYRTIQQAEALANEYSAREPYWQTALRLAFLELLLTVIRRGNPKHSTPQLFSQANTGRILTVIDYVRKNLDKKIALDEAADLGRMGRTLFSRTFRNIMGITFTQYALKSRLERAHQDILRGEDKLSSIAQHWGFSDTSHFINQYRRHFGQTPGLVKSGKGR
jgi:AraC-like DNA-binding protein